ncbi:ABC transporter ATP-binding protein/permease [bacterium]|nr:ABC transporter ATP-binding protein/permease [bacterium]
MRPAEFDPQSNSDNDTAHSKTLRELARHLWPKGRFDLKFRVFFALFFLAAAKGLNVYVPYLLKLSIDKLTPGESALALPFALILAYGIARLGVAVFGEVRDLFFVKVVQHAQRAIGLSTFKHLHELSLDFHLSRQTGGLSRVIERGTRGVQFVLRFLTFNILPTLIELTLVTGVLVYYFDYSYAVVILVTIIFYIGITIWITDWRLRFRKVMNAKESKANTSAIDSLLNYETVKYFGNEEHEYRRFDESLAGYEKAAIRSQSSLSVLNILQSLVICIGLAVIMLHAARGVVEGSMTIGDFVLVNTYLIQIYLPLNFLGFVYREVKNSLVDMEKMFELLRVNADVCDAPGAIELCKSAANIEFKNVHFAYNPSRKILKGISFCVPAGKNIAIVGSSGAGKSTISRLLFRFYDVNEGSICVGGKDLRELSQKSLRASIGVVPQDTVLFNDTIGYNINYGDPSANFEQVKEAAKLAQLDSFIDSLPKGFDTEVGERGLKLSGGEKQRVAIARALLKKPKILLFDEATSSLDTRTEQDILMSFKEISRNYTTLSIAHRLSTVVDSDEIIVLSEGRITERGSHEKLLALNGLYKSMWDSQVQEKSVYR